MKVVHYLHKPTGWLYLDDPECSIYLIPENGHWKIPKSLAVFGNPKDWEITTVWIDEINTLEWVNSVINFSLNGR